MSMKWLLGLAPIGASAIAGTLFGISACVPNPQETAWVEHSTPLNEICPEQTVNEVADLPAVNPKIVNEPEFIFYDAPLSYDVQEYISELCVEKGLPQALVMAVIETESGFQPDIVSSAGDYGLMQINKINHDWIAERYGVTDILEPKQNVLAGVSILADHYNHCEGNLHKTLMCYNLGAGGAKRKWDNGILTTAYSETVIERMGKYEIE